MNFIQKLERKFGRYAIHNLMTYIIILYVIGWMIQIFNAEFYYAALSLDIDAILHGQVWRIITFIIMPPENSSYIFMIFTLYLYYILGTNLERVWGAFRFNVYFFYGSYFSCAGRIFNLFYIWGELAADHLLSEYVAVFCFCNGLSGYGAVSVFYSAH